MSQALKRARGSGCDVKGAIGWVVMGEKWQRCQYEISTRRRLKAADARCFAANRRRGEVGDGAGGRLRI
jgi:hypothetical protein